MGWEFRVLGPLEVVHDGTVVPIPAAMQRGLLACLLLEANRVVPVPTLAEQLWGDEQPKDVRTTLRGYVMRLRKALGADRIQTREPGYVAVVADGELDLARFRDLVARAHADPDDRDHRWAEALRLWRGEPLADVPCDALHRDRVPVLTEQRLAALESRIDADLRRGAHAALLPELHELVRAHPLRERYWAQLMIAQHATARQAEALATYQAVRAVLREELGIEPSPELRELHRAVAAGEPLRPTDTKQPRPVPAQLPPDVYGFTGRDACLTRLDEIARSGDGAVIGALTGTAGAGKTALALRWAHHNRERYPDGQLYLDLCGHGPQPPLSPADALARLLRSLGAAVPADTAERAALFRSLVDGRRLLLLLDNAESAEQVRPLLPGSRSCLVLVTSRDDLAGLVARDGARRVEVALLPPDEANALLRALVGSRVDDEPAAARTLAERCANLPLALRVAAEVAAGSTAPLAEVAAALSDDHRRARLLESGGDAASMVFTVFSWSVGRLADDAARAFAMLGRHPGRSFDAHAVAALTGRDLGAAEELARTLAKAHLIEADGPRYRIHDLLHSYAADLAGRGEHAADAEAAAERLLGHYLAAAAAAVDLISPFDSYTRPVVAPTPTTPAFPDRNAAMRWLDAERQNLVSGCVAAASSGFSAHVVAVTRVLVRYLDIEGYFDEAAQMCGLAVPISRRSGDALSLGWLLGYEGLIRFRLGHREDAGRLLDEALDLAREHGLAVIESNALNYLGILELTLRTSLDYGEKALELDVATGDRYAEIRTRINLTSTLQRMGRVEEAREQGRRALALAEEDGNLPAAVRALNNLGCIELNLFRNDEALVHLRRALDLTRSTGDRALRGYLLSNIGIVHARTGRLTEAGLEQRQAHALAHEVGDRGLQSSTGNALGELARLSGQLAQAADHHRAALHLAKRIDYRFQVKRAHEGLARIALERGELDRAAEHREVADRVSAGLGVPVDAELGARLDQAMADRAAAGEPACR